MEIKIEVYRDGWTKALQLSIGDGRTGYRIAGPKFSGGREVLLSKKLDKRDIKEIRAYLDQANNECTCAPGQGGPCAHCMEMKYNL